MTHNNYPEGLLVHTSSQYLDRPILMFLAACLLLVGLGVRGVRAQQPAPTDQRIIVKFRPETPFIQRLGLRKDAGARLRRSLPAEQLHVWTLPRGEASLQRLRAQPEVLWAEPDYQYEALESPNDPDFSRQWGLQNNAQPGADVHASDAWELSTGSEAVTVAIIDGGVDWRHPDLAENIWQNAGEDLDGDGVLVFLNGQWQFDPDDQNGIDDDGNGFPDDFIGWDFANNDNNPYDDSPNGHGTHVAGILGARTNNGTGISGVSWHSRIMPLKFLNQDSKGYVSDAVAAIDYALRMGAQVSNNSWGGYGYSQALYEALNRTHEAAHAFVAAAGNNRGNNDERPLYPASYDFDNLISVAASDQEDQLAAFSNYGPNSVDLAAPGVDIYSTLPGGRYGSLSGTSMAAPFVSGTLALMLAQGPEDRMDDHIGNLLFSVDQPEAFHGKITSSGRLNAFRALSANEHLPRNPAGCHLNLRFRPTDYTSCPGRPLFIRNQSRRLDSYKWYVDDELVSTNRDLTYAFEEAGLYRVTLLGSKGACHQRVSQYITILGAPTSSLRDTAICKAAISLEAGFQAASYRWTNEQGQFLGQTASLRVNESGLYSLTTVDGCGTAYTQTSTVTLSGDCVWPGDANVDGVVNSLDALFIGLAHGAEGPARPHAGTDFAAQPSPGEWEGHFPPNAWGEAINFKHADCNGDGRVDQQDIETVFANASDDCEQYQLEAPSQASMSLSLQPHQQALAFGDRFTFDVILEASHRHQLKDVHGIAFSLMYNIPLQEDFQFNTQGSWLGHPQDLQLFAKGPNPTAVFQGQACTRVVLTRLDQEGSSGNDGFVAQGWITISVEDIDAYTLMNDKPQLSFAIAEAALIKTDGSLIPLPQVTSLAEGGIDLLPARPGFSFFPNPAHRELTLRWRHTATEPATITLTNMLGEQVLAHKLTLTMGENHFKLSLPALAPGVYTLQAASQQTQKPISKKLIIK